MTVCSAIRQKEGGRAAASLGGSVERETLIARGSERDIEHAATPDGPADAEQPVHLIIGFDGVELERLIACHG